ncbi:MAG: cysteine--tRNA ligase [Proteobacteria bacterium]|nr:cysteine--tRNA ligase [Pseudomonadota bacterium]
MKMQFFNTLSNKLETFTAIDPKHLKMYVCGPTVYDRPHLGNARSIVVYDLLFRFFLEAFPRVTFVRNITDVDDKINAAAIEQKISIQSLTEKIIAFFYQDIDALNVLRPTFEPRATLHIPEMINMIEKLIANGFAYQNQGHVLFDVAAYKNYGQLSNRTLDEMIAGARVEIATYKKNPLDFVLWKPADKQDDVSSVFESPWGKGRPGWHIECSAMSSKYLGDNFDVHGGGADLQFPHHENEIAQSCCANLGSHYANFWIHNGFLTVDGEKMSKSLKNFITVRDLLDQGFAGITIRYLLLSTHYHKPFDFNQKALIDAKKSVEKFYTLFDESELKSYQSGKYKEGLFFEVLQELANDLNVSKTFALLHEKAKEIRTENNQNLKNQFLQTLDFLGLLDVSFFTKKNSSDIDEAYIATQIELRIKAKQEKNWALSDQIRDDLLKIGIALKDSKEGTSWQKV